MLPLVFVLTACLSISSVSPTRNTPTLLHPTPSTMAARLEDAGGITQCWNALLQLRSCSNEVIAFFLNGHTDLGADCCKAITIITRDCWPAMLSSLGFTAEEGNVLRGYCDGSGHDTTPAAPPLHAPSPSAVLQDFTSST
uniref:Prolamin-like domain-containing protein n=1 Tax=Kalanchoe fedtschenkoi TaxID=63787 RepID=A0A7N0T8X4_KALFE